MQSNWRLVDSVVVPRGRLGYNTSPSIVSGASAVHGDLATTTDAAVFFIWKRWPRVYRPQISLSLGPWLQRVVDGTSKYSETITQCRRRGVAQLSACINACLSVARTSATVKERSLSNWTPAGRRA